MIDITKIYKYRNGEPARVLCVDALGPQPVISVDTNGNPSTHCADGKWNTFDTPHSRDLIEVREPRVIWVNEYPEGLCEGGHFKTAEKAVVSSASNLIATRKFVEVIEP